MGILAASISGYYYGLSDHLQHLPTIFRVMDQNFLINDFYTNTTSEFGPRYFYVRLFGHLGRFIELPLLFFIIYLGLYISISLITGLATRDITGSNFAGMIAVTLTVGITPFHLGNGADVVSQGVIPTFLAMPFSLVAIWKGLRGKAIETSIVSIPAILIQPVIGIEMACIALFAAGAYRITVNKMLGLRLSFKQWQDFAIACAILIIVCLIWMVPAFMTKATFVLDTDEFVHILAYVRHPHHMVPTTWSPVEFMLGIFFLLTVSLSLFKTNADFNLAYEQPVRLSGCRIAMAAVFLLVIFGTFLGYVFVEIFPTRLVAVAQPFRLLNVISWIGWIVIGGIIAKQIYLGRWTISLLGMLSVLTAPSLLFYRVFRDQKIFASNVNGKYKLEYTVFSFVIVSLILICMVLFDFRLTIDEIILVAIGFFVALLILLKCESIAISCLVGILLLVISIQTLDRFDYIPELPKVSNLIAKSQPILTLEEVSNKPACDCVDLVNLAAFAKENTSKHSVFLTPYSWGLWRLVAERAILSDKKAFPFRDDGLIEWERRRQQIYLKYGYDLRQLGDQDLIKLSNEYGFQYAILPVDVDVSYPVIYISGEFKMIHIEDKETF